MKLARLLARLLQVRLRREVVAAGLLLPWLVLWPWVAGSKLLAPTEVLAGQVPGTLASGPMKGHALELSDEMFQFYPWELEVRHAFSEGRWPFWSDRIDGGSSPWANPSAEMLMPPPIVIPPVTPDVNVGLMPTPVTLRAPEIVGAKVPLIATAAAAIRKSSSVDAPLTKRICVPDACVTPVMWTPFPTSVVLRAVVSSFRLTVPALLSVIVEATVTRLPVPVNVMSPSPVIVTAAPTIAN